MKTPFRLFAALLFCIFFVCCATKDSTDAEIRRAQFAVTVASVSLDFAKEAFAEELLNDGSPAVIALKRAAIKTAEKELADEEARLAALVKSRQDAMAAKLTLPAVEITATK